MPSFFVAAAHLKEGFQPRISIVRAIRRQMFHMVICGAALFPAIALSETQQECEARWLAAEKAGIVYGVGMVGGQPTASVDEDTFMAVDFTTKTGFAETLNCALVGPGKAVVSIDLVSHRTNKRLARWTPVTGLVVD